MRLRLLKYSIRIWEEDCRRYPDEKHLRPIVPLVLYQGRRGWTPALEFVELFAPAVRDWPWVPRYAHLLLDQTRVRPEELRGQPRGRATQIAMMAFYRRSWEVLQRFRNSAGDRRDRRVARCHVVRGGGDKRDPERWNRFAEAVRREVPGGGELMTETQGMLEAITDLMRQEARQEAAMTQVRTIEGLLRQDVPWSTIAAATGIDEAEFGRLKQQLGATANGPAAGAGHTN